MRSRAERDRCEKCGGAAEPVRGRYTWQYLAGAAVILAGAAFLLLPQASSGIPWAPLVETFGLRIAWLVAFVGIGYVLASWGVRVMKANALADAIAEAEA